MLTVNKTLGNLKSTPLEGIAIDYLPIEWYESNKKIQRKKTESGTEIAIRFLTAGQKLNQDDILYRDDKKAIVVTIIPCDTIVISPDSLLEMGTVCYEIGNKHLPLFIQEDKVLMPFETPMFRWLESAGYHPKKENCKLLNLLKSNVTPHSHSGNGGKDTIFSKILNMASNVSR